MDSVTQVALGAAVGELVLGKKVANKAPLWGAIAGTIPDLDVVFNPFLDSIQKLTFHRGFSHSFLFAVLLAPILGFLISRIYRKNPEASWRDWTLLIFWCVFTHPILDSLTTYGTQLFLPFSSYAVDFSMVFVVDPFYTVPLGGFVVAVLFFSKQTKTRRILNGLGLAISCGYLLFSIGNKVHTGMVFRDALSKQGSEYQRLLTSPTPFNNILWRGLAEEQDGYRIGFYSLLDSDSKISFEFLPRNEHLIRQIRNDPAIEQLILRSNGYYTISDRDGTLYFNDLRFVELNSWTRGLPRQHVFSYRITRSDPKTGAAVSIERIPPSMDAPGNAFGSLLDRVSGKRPVTEDDYER